MADNEQLVDAGESPAPQSSGGLENPDSVRAQGRYVVGSDGGMGWVGWVGWVATRRITPHDTAETSAAAGRWRPAVGGDVSGFTATETASHAGGRLGGRVRCGGPAHRPAAAVRRGALRIVRKENWRELCCGSGRLGHGQPRSACQRACWLEHPPKGESSRVRVASVWCESVRLGFGSGRQRCPLNEAQRPTLARRTEAERGSTGQLARPT